MRIIKITHLRTQGLQCFFCFFAMMAKERKISVRTPSEVYSKLMQRAYDLNLSHREYYLALAMKDLGMEGKGDILDEKLAEKLKTRIKELDKEK